MKTGSISKLSNFIQDLYNSEKADSRGSSRSRGPSKEEIKEAISKIKESRQARKNQESIQPVEDNPEYHILPIDGPSFETDIKPIDKKVVPKADTIDELATLYVEQYSSESGVKLSEDQFKAKVAEVSSLYSSLQNGKERLDEVVFANDIEA